MAKTAWQPGSSLTRPSPAVSRREIYAAALSPKPCAPRTVISMPSRSAAASCGSRTSVNPPAPRRELSQSRPPKAAAQPVISSAAAMTAARTAAARLPRGLIPSSARTAPLTSGAASSRSKHSKASSMARSSLSRSAMVTPRFRRRSAALRAAFLPFRISCAPRPRLCRGARRARRSPRPPARGPGRAPCPRPGGARARP